jgi:hypothetical protein
MAFWDTLSNNAKFIKTFLYICCINHGCIGTLKFWKTDKKKLNFSLILQIRECTLLSLTFIWESELHIASCSMHNLMRIGDVAQAYRKILIDRHHWRDKRLVFNEDWYGGFLSKIPTVYWNSWSEDGQWWRLRVEIEWRVYREIKIYWL